MHERSRELFGEIADKRSLGTVTTAAIPRDPGRSARDAADQIASSQTFRQLGDRWLEVDDPTAYKIVARLLRKDMAYGVPIMAPEEAARLAHEFMLLTGTPRVCLTNGGWLEDPISTSPTTKIGPSWDPITESTFDAGVIFVDEDAVVMLWVEDED